MRRILVIDDDDRLLSLITSALKMNDFNAIGAISASQARMKLNEEHFDLLIVDWMMPNENGVDFVKALRNSASHLKDIPVIMLTAVDDIDKKVEGFESGVDDYITKPFEIKDLIARINSLLRRTCVAQPVSILKFGNCEFNLNTDELRKDSEIVNLSTTELDLLKTLATRPNKPFSRIDLAKKLSFQVSDRTIDVQINRLRKKIGDNPKAPTIVRTVRYIGYALYIDD